MRKAACLIVAFVIVYCPVQSQETTSGLVCGASEETHDCRSSPRASVLLQVARSQPHIQVPSGSAGQEAIDENEGGGKDLRPASAKDLLKLTKPMQTQIDGIEQRVESLEKAQARIHSATAKDGSQAPGKQEESGHQQHQPDEARRHADIAEDGSQASGKQEESAQQQHQPDAHIVENEDSHGENEDWAWKNETDDEEERLQRPSDNSTEMVRRREDGGGTNNQSARRQGEAPDWGGVAPRAWNGLEHVNAEDSGRNASWKGNGTGVSSGRKYSGEYPYETMMDVDYVIDSNPELTTALTTKAFTTRAPRTTVERTTTARPERTPGTTVEARKPGKSGSKHGGKAKSQAKHGGKQSPSVLPKVSPKASPKTSPLTPAKTAPKHGGKSRTSPIHGGKASQSEPSKTAPIHGGKGKPNSPVSGGKSNPLEPAKTGPTHGGKGKSSSDSESEPA